MVCVCLCKINNFLLILHHNRDKLRVTSRGLNYNLMAEIIEITSLDDPRTAPFSRLTEAQLRAGFETGERMFIAESPKVIRVALDSGYEPLALMCEEKHIGGDARDVIERCGDIPLYTGPRDLLTGITGYKLTRGVLCAMRRPEELPLERVALGAGRLAVIHGVTDTTNIGAIFRSAAALGIDGVVLSRDSCDPLNRRAVRVSMGTVFRIQWTWAANPVKELRKLGFRSVAMALTEKSISLRDPRLQREERLAIVMGTEGDGLPQLVIDSCDYTVMIPMARGVDSLNVAAASAVAFWQLAAR